MPCNTCGHDTDACDACQRVGDTVQSGQSSQSEEHKKHVAECPGAADKLRPTTQHPGGLPGGARYGSMVRSGDLTPYPLS
jgi:hypothetical protein